MELRLRDGSAIPGLTLHATFADYERPAVNGLSASMFLAVSGATARPDLRGLRLVMGVQPISEATHFRDDPDALRQLVPGHEQRAVYCHVSINRLVLRPDEELDVVVDCGAGNQYLGTIEIAGNRTDEIVPKVRLRPRPVLITSLGRSGSTVLANSLGLHPRVMSVGDYPFEYRFFSYCLQAINVLTSPANHDTSMGGDAFEQRQLFQIGFNPFNNRGYDRRIKHDALRNYYEGPYAREVAEFMLRRGEAAMSLVAPQKQGAVAFVEKMAGTHLANLARNLCQEIDEIVLTRDFWDMVSSMIGFDRKRGEACFLSDNPRWLSGMALQHANLVKRASRPESIHVRYEGLMGRTADTMAGLLARLGLERDAAALDAVLAPFAASEYRQVHATQRVDDAEIRRLFAPEIVARTDAILAAEERPA